MLRLSVTDSRDLHVSTPRGNVQVHFSPVNERWRVVVGGCEWTLVTPGPVSNFRRGDSRLQLRRGRKTMLRSLSHFSGDSGQSSIIPVMFVTCRRGTGVSPAEEGAPPLQVWLSIVVPLVQGYDPQLVHSEELPAGNHEVEDYFTDAFWTSGSGLPTVVDQSPARRTSLPPLLRALCYTLLIPAAAIGIISLLAILVPLLVFLGCGGLIVIAATLVGAAAKLCTRKDTR